MKRLEKIKLWDESPESKTIDTIDFSLNVASEPFTNLEANEVGELITLEELRVSGHTGSLGKRLIMNDGILSCDTVRSCVSKFCEDNNLEDASDIVIYDSYDLSYRKVNCGDFVLVNVITREAVLNYFKVSSVFDLLGYTGEFEDLVSFFIAKDTRIALSRLIRKVDRLYLNIEDRLDGANIYGVYKSYSVKVLLDNCDEVVPKIDITKGDLIKSLTYVKIRKPNLDNVNIFARGIYKFAVLNALNLRHARDTDKFNYLNSNGYLDKPACIQKIKDLLLK